MPQADFLRTITTSGNQYGALHSTFSFDLSRGYTVFTGANNAGKSALLQLIFRHLIDDGEFGVHGVCLIPADRQYLAASHETGGAGFGAFNETYVNQIRAHPMPSEGARPENSSLGRLLISHDEMLRQSGQVSELLVRLGLPELQVREGQRIHFNDVEGFFQGSGLRALYPILAALTDSRLNAILIDEPELSLEPTLQRGLRDLLVEHATGDRSVIVSTHSHLFLDRQTIEANCVLRQTGDFRELTGRVELEQVADERGLQDVVFRLLGNSTEDLFFPYNYAIVEGASDQVVVQKACELLRPDRSVKVLSATGITEIESAVFAVERALLPMIVGDSPYARRVVAAVDDPREEHRSRVEELRRHLGERLVELPAASLEEYVPSPVYEAAELDRDAELARIEAAADFNESRRIKAEISTRLAMSLTPELLVHIPEIVRLVALATQEA